MDNPNNQVTFVNFLFNSNKHILYNKVMTYKIANVPHLLHGVVIFYSLQNNKSHFKPLSMRGVRGVFVEAGSRFLISPQIDFGLPAFRKSLPANRMINWISLANFSPQIEFFSPQLDSTSPHLEKYKSKYLLDCPPSNIYQTKPYVLGSCRSFWEQILSCLANVDSELN